MTSTFIYVTQTQKQEITKNTNTFFDSFFNCCIDIKKLYSDFLNNVDLNTISILELDTLRIHIREYNENLCRNINSFKMKNRDYGKVFEAIRETLMRDFVFDLNCLLNIFSLLDTFNTSCTRNLRDLDEMCSIFKTICLFLKYSIKKIELTIDNKDQIKTAATAKYASKIKMTN